ncbi:MAG: substrate-binding domain-containing protein [Proteobacteria bacterium]|nr:substrate-binding domain-containing protein [Pseudomonadota bacterium]
MAGQSTPLKVMCALAIRQAFDQIIVPDLAAAGVTLEIDWNPTTVIMTTIEAGGRADALVIMTEAMDILAARGLVDPASRFEVVQSRVGIAVPRGAPHPDISSVDALKQTLLNARSVAYSQAGASGIHFRTVLDQLGIADAIKAKATVIPAGFTAEKLVTGEADIAVQQISELMTVRNVEIVGRFPDAVQKASRLAAALFTDTPNRAGARQFLDALRSDRAIEAYRSTGLDLVPR